MAETATLDPLAKLYDHRASWEPIIVSYLLTDGATHGANWDFVVQDHGRWWVETRSHHVDIDTLQPFTTPDRPAVFTDVGAYLRWLDESGIRRDEATDNYIRANAVNTIGVAFLRCRSRGCWCPYPGGYWCAMFRDRPDQPAGRHWITVCDMDDQVFAFQTNDAARYNELRDYLLNVPELMGVDFADLGMEC